MRRFNTAHWQSSRYDQPYMKLIMFDIDGTLTESILADATCFVQALEQEFGFKQINTDWSSYPHCTDAGILHHLFEQRQGRSPAARELAAFQDRFLQLLTESIRRQSLVPVRGAIPMLDHLQSRPDCAISLASGAWERSARMKLASAGLQCDHLPAAFSNDSHQREQIMLTSLARAARSKGRESFDSVIYVGDGLWDARACKNLGWPFIGVASDPAKAARLRAEGACHVVADYHDLKDFIKSLEM